MGTLERGRADLREPQVPDLAVLDEARHRADGILDRVPGIDPVKVVEVDRVDAEAFQARLGRPANILGAPVDGTSTGGGVVDEPELGRQEHSVPTSPDRLPDERLVRVRTVDVGRIEEVHAELERAIDRRERLRLVPRSVALAHPHATEPERRDRRAVTTKGPSRNGHATPVVPARGPGDQ